MNEADWDYYYEGYIKWGDLVLTTIIPVFVLSYCTIRIIIALRKNKSTNIFLGKLSIDNAATCCQTDAVTNSTGLTNSKMTCSSIRYLLYVLYYASALHTFKYI